MSRDQVFRDQDFWLSRLEPGEVLLWTARAKVRHIALPVLSLVWLFVLIADDAITNLFVHESLAQACGVEPRKSCRQLYQLAWPMLVVSVALLLLLGGVLICLITGWLVTRYAITSQSIHHAISGLHNTHRKHPLPETLPRKRFLSFQWPGSNVRLVGLSADEITWAIYAVKLYRAGIR